MAEEATLDPNDMDANGGDGPRLSDFQREQAKRTDGDAEMHMMTFVRGGKPMTMAQLKEHEDNSDDALLVPPEKPADYEQHAQSVRDMIADDTATQRARAGQ